MSKPTLLQKKVSKAIWILFFSLPAGAVVQAQGIADSSKIPVLASTSPQSNKPVLKIEPNVVFPAVLAGNEAETLAYIEKFAVNRRAYLIRTYNRSKQFFPKVSTILKQHNLPHELKVLLALESAFNANAVSKAGAVGYWQFMDEVAKEYGLKYVAQQKATNKKTAAPKKTGTNKKAPVTKDDRKNFTKSTQAAARYLKDRSRNLDNDLLLMVASYNCGVGNVWEAMKKSGKTNPDFWDIKTYLPAETQAYVMNFITLNVIFHNYEKFNDYSLVFTPQVIRIPSFEGNITSELYDAGIQ